MRDYDTDKRTIDLTVMGTLDCSCEGKNIEFLQKTDTKMAQFFLLLLLDNHKGLAKNTLLEYLYKYSDADRANSLKTLFARLRAQLSRDLGLAGSDIIDLSGGFYSLSPNIEVNCDYFDFLNGCRTALAETDLLLKTDMLLEALTLYTGELLPMISTEYWVIISNTILTDIFSQSTRELVACLEEQERYEEAYNAYKRAQRFFPYEEEWIIGAINILKLAGRSRQAVEEYEIAVRRLTDDLGVYPSERMLDALKSARRGLSEFASVERDAVLSGARYCTWPNFSYIFDAMNAIMRREQVPATLLMITVADSQGVPLEDENQILSAVSSLHIAVSKTLRSTDLFTRYSQGKILVLLWNAPQENADIVMRRITERFEREDRTGRFKLLGRIYPADRLPADPTEGKRKSVFGSKRWNAIV